MINKFTFGRCCKRLVTLVVALLMCVTYADVPIASAPFANSAHKPAPVIRSVGKSSAPLLFVNPGRFKVDNGSALTVELRIRALDTLSHVSVQVNAENGVILATETVPPVTALAAGDEMQLKIDVIAVSEGLSYVNVIVSTRSGRGTGMSSYSIPVEVGDLARGAGRASKAHFSQDQNGVVLHVLKAREQGTRK